MFRRRLLLIKRLTLIATVFSLLVIALGAYTRLVHAGLGCPDWPTCYGHLWAPLSSIEIADANSAFPDNPVNLDKTWPEMIHRYLATGLGFLCLVIAYFAFKLRKLPEQLVANRSLQIFPYRHCLGLLCLVVLQGMFGMWTVTLKLWPQVVTLHLLGGFTTFSLLLLLYFRLSVVSIVCGLSIQSEQEKTKTAQAWLRILAGVVLVMVIIQVMLGGWTSSNYAALACPQLAWCSTVQLSDQDFWRGFNWLQEIGPNYLGGQLDGGARVAIHLAHRLGALLVIVFALILIGSLYYKGLIKLALMLTLMVLAQVSLGLSNVYFNLPLLNAVAHNIGGALLVGLLVIINFELTPSAAPN
ncbi:MAG: COX15/CtaA family protein [Gammaproteobacteria bacterium]|nr:COX15/CtaA family protein [Gammaproteobacteria bacterium]